MRVVALVVLLLGCAHFQPDPWQRGLGSDAYVKVVNRSATPCAVVAVGVEQDRRELGTVGAVDSVTFRLPLADQKVLVQACSSSATFNVYQPHTWRLEVP